MTIASRGMDDIKKTKIKFLEMKAIMSEMKNIQDRSSDRRKD